MTLAQLLNATAARRVIGPLEVPIAGLRHDSRAVRAGDIFFALPGSKTDGDRHVEQAFDNGAVAVVSELPPPPGLISTGTLPAAAGSGIPAPNARSEALLPDSLRQGTWIQVADIAEAMARISDLFYDHPSGAMTIVGVTGTNGKTTTTYILESIVVAAGGKPAVIGTIENRLNCVSLEKSLNTTPISLTLTKRLSRFRDSGASHALLEVSSHALSLKRVERVDFDAAIFLNLKRDHLDYHKTEENYFNAKARLFELLSRADNKKTPKVAALNFDDPRARLLLNKAVDCEVIRFGLTENATDLKGKILKMDLNGTDFTVNFRGKTHDARVRLPGLHNVENALAAAAAMLGLRANINSVFDGIAALRAVPGRLESIDEGQDFHVFIDYAHTESALESILKLLRSLPHRKIITVVGCGGDRDKTKRGPMGIAACRGGDFSIFTSDNPRSEDPLTILTAIEDGVSGLGLRNYKIIADRVSAIADALARARAGDIVLIAGKGHEDCQILADRTIAFDDRIVARSSLKSLNT